MLKVDFFCEKMDNNCFGSVQCEMSDEPVGMFCYM